MTSGRFITLEGGEGGGKTTNLDFIANTLSRQGIDVITTREPGGTPVAERIRDIFLDPDTPEPIAPDTDLLLVFAARAQHLDQVIKPAVQQGKWVVCSRFTDSTYAYQGGGNQLKSRRIDTLADWVHGDFQPDLTLILDLPIEVGMQRAQARGQLDRIEQQDIEFFERVRDTYHQRAASDSRYVLIDASHDLKTVQRCIQLALNRLT